MTRYNNGLDGGTSGVTITNGNSGGASGDAWDAVVSTPKFDSTRSMHGSNSMLLASGATANYVYWNVSSTDIAIRFYVYFTAAASAEYSMCRVYNASSSIVLQVNLLGTKKVRIYGAAGSTIGTFASDIPLNQWVRIEVKALQGSSTNVSAEWFLGDSPTVIDTAITSGAANTGTAAFASTRFGKLATSGLDAHWMDSCAVETAASSTYIGPAVTLSTSTVVAISSSTGWIATGAASVLLALANPSDTDFATSVDNPSSAAIVGTLGPLAAPAGDFTMQIRLDKENASTGTMVVKLYDGATLRATVSGVSIPDPISTVDVTFLAASITAVTSWSTGVGFRLEVTAA